MIRTVDQLSDEDFGKIASDIDALDKAKDEEQLCELVGNALYDSGLSVTVSDASNAGDILEPVVFESQGDDISIDKAVGFVMDTDALPKSVARRSGKNLMKRVRQAICNDPKLSKAFSDDATLKDCLKVIIPYLVNLLKLGPLTAPALVIIAGVVALILKVGYKSYCNITPSPAGSNS